MNKSLSIILISTLIVLSLCSQTIKSAELKWEPMNEGLPNPEITDIEICPANPRVLYAVAKRVGVYKSVDSGENWVIKNAGIEDIDISFLKCDPVDPNVIYAIGSEMFISKDGGNSWSIIELPEGAETTCLSINPKNSKVIFLGTNNQGIIKSVDYGKTWIQANVGLKKDEYSYYPLITCIFFDYDSEDTLYAGTTEGIFKSNDLGKSWQKIINGLTYKAKVIVNTPVGPKEEETELTAVVYEGFDFPDSTGKVLIATNIGLFITTDGGNNWIKVSELEGTNIKTLKVGKDQKRITAVANEYIFDSFDGGLSWEKSKLGKDFKLNDAEVYFGDQTEIYFATDLGVFKSIDGGKSLIDLNRGIHCLNVSYITSSLDRQVIYLSTYNYGLFKYDLLSKKWDKISNIGEEVTINSVICDAHEEKTLYIGTDEGVLISKNGGDTFDLRIESLNYVYSLICPKENILIAGTGNGIYMSEDKGITWKVVFNGETQDITVISLANAGNGVIYAGTVNSGILKSSDYGKTWFPINNGLESPYPPINVILANLNNPSLVYAGTEGSGLLKSMDGGSTWKPTRNYPTPWVKDLAIDKQGEIYGIFSPNGIYKSLDGGESWIEVNSNLPSKEIYKLTFIDDELFIASKVGIYRLTVLYNIKVTYSQGGSIYPESLSEIKQGDSKTFTITPNPGYKIKDVKVDGVSKGSISSYTFTNITSDHTISATFEKEITQTIIILKIGNPTFTVNGSTRTLDSPPILKNGRTLLPVRAVVEALGGTLGWDASTKKVTVSLSSTTIELWIGKPIAKVSGINTPIDATNPKVVPEIINGRTMLPLRFVAESLGCDVGWDGTTKTITITYKR